MAGFSPNVTPTLWAESTQWSQVWESGQAAWDPLGLLSPVVEPLSYKPEQEWSWAQYSQRLFTQDRAMDWGLGRREYPPLDCSGLWLSSRYQGAGRDRLKSSYSSEGSSPTRSRRRRKPCAFDCGGLGRSPCFPCGEGRGGTGLSLNTVDLSCLTKCILE